MEEKRKRTSFYISDILGDDSQRPVAAAAAAATAPGEDAAAIPAMSPASTTMANPGTEAPDDGSSGEDSRSCDAAAAGVRRLLPVAQGAAGNHGGGFALIDERWARLAPELVFLQTFCAHASLASLSCSRVTQQLPTDYSKTASKVRVGNDDSNTQKKCRRSRTVFSETQLLSLEKKFESHKYLSTPQRIDLAEILGLTQLQVKTWYQNRRMKWKQEVLQNGAAQCPTKPKGRPKKLPAAVEHIKRPAPTEPIPTP